MEELKIIQLSEIQKNPYQPRKDFSEEKIQDKINRYKLDIATYFRQIV